MAKGSSEKRSLRNGARHTQRVIRRLLLDWDAIGGVPDDEYDCMIGPLYKLIRQGSSTEEIAAWVGDYRCDHFGLDDDCEADTRLAELLLMALADHQ